jgi:carbonic anhydrase
MRSPEGEICVMEHYKCAAWSVTFEPKEESEFMAHLATELVNTQYKTKVIGLGQ